MISMCSKDLGYFLGFDGQISNLRNLRNFFLNFRNFHKFSQDVVKGQARNKLVIGTTFPRS